MANYKVEHQGIWLEVSNVRMDTSSGTGAQLEVQLKGDKADREPVWWIVSVPDGTSKNSVEKIAQKQRGITDLHRQVADALDKKRPVLAQLCSDEQDRAYLLVKYYRIQFSDATR